MKITDVKVIKSDSEHGSDALLLTFDERQHGRVLLLSPGSAGMTQVFEAGAAYAAEIFAANPESV